MNTPISTNRYKNHRFPAEIISHGVWLYYRFCLSYRAVEELLFARGVIVSYEAIRKWCRTFGQQYANQLRRRRPRPGDEWHLDNEDIAFDGPQAGDHTIGASANGLDRLTAGTAVAEEIPAGPLLADIGGAPTLILAIIPFLEVWVDLSLGAKSRQLTCPAGPCADR
jgi:hypothetical protein